MYFTKLHLSSTRHAGIILMATILSLLVMIEVKILTCLPSSIGTQSADDSIDYIVPLHHDSLRRSRRLDIHSTVVDEHVEQGEAPYSSTFKPLKQKQYNMDKRKEEQEEAIHDTASIESVDSFMQDAGGPLEETNNAMLVDEQCYLGGQLDEISYAAIQKIRKGIIHNKKLLASIPPNVPRPKILCMVYTHEGAHETKLKAIVDTWANDCDGFFAASNVTDASLGAMKLDFPGPESYANMWQKVQAMWIYAYHHYIDEYDYFHICGDDVYVVADNLRMFAMSDFVQKLSNGYLDTFSVMSKHKRKWRKSRPRALVFGYPLHIDLRKNGLHQYAAGGSGYTFNREAVRVFYNLITNFTDNSTDSREDILVARWLELEGITVSDTRDETGAFRYMPNNPIMDYPCLHRWPLKHLDSKVECKPGLDAFSNETISIHLNYEKIRRLSEIINYTENIIYRYDYLLTGGGEGRHYIQHSHHQQEGGGCDSQLQSFQPNITRMELLSQSQRKSFKKYQVDLLKDMLRNMNNLAADK